MVHVLHATCSDFALIHYYASNNKDMFLYLSRTIAIIVFVGVVNNTIAGHGIEVNQSAP